MGAAEVHRSDGGAVVEKKFLDHFDHLRVPCRKGIDTPIKT